MRPMWSLRLRSVTGGGGGVPKSKPVKPKVKPTRAVAPKVCARAWTHREGVYCSTCGKTAKVRGA